MEHMLVLNSKQFFSLFLAYIFIEFDVYKILPACVQGVQEKVSGHLGLRVGSQTSEPDLSGPALKEANSNDYRDPRPPKKKNKTATNTNTQEPTGKQKAHNA